MEWDADPEPPSEADVTGNVPDSHGEVGRVGGHVVLKAFQLVDAFTRQGEETGPGRVQGELLVEAGLVLVSCVWYEIQIGAGIRNSDAPASK